MKRSIRFILLSLVLGLILANFTACAANVKESSDESGQEIASDRSQLGIDNMGSNPEESVDQEENNKIITTMHLSFETNEFDATEKKLNKLVGKYKGYIESSDISHDENYAAKKYKYGEFKIRIPKNSLASFRDELKGVGNLIYESTNKDDVTKTYKDTESRLKVITTKEERILSLLEKADKMEDIIALENQLTEIIYEKEMLQTQLMDIDHKVDYSTILINIQEVEKLSEQETLETKFVTRIKNAFKNSFYSFRKSMEAFIILFIHLLPYIIILGALGFFGYKILKRIRKNKS